MRRVRAREKVRTRRVTMSRCAIRRLTTMLLYAALPDAAPRAALRLCAPLLRCLRAATGTRRAMSIILRGAAAARTVRAACARSVTRYARSA